VITPLRFILGIWIMLGVFSLKAGIGLYLACKNRQGPLSRVRMFAMYLVTYLFLFSILGYLWMMDKNIGRLSRLLIRFGQEIHLLVSFSLMVLGYYFLIKNQHKADKNVWLGLLIPCPICISTIFLTLGFALQYFPSSNFLIISLAYSGFVFLGLMAFLGTWLFETSRGDFKHSHIVGGILIISSLYTMLTLLLSSGIAQAKSIVSMSVNKFDMSVSSNQLVSAIIGIFFIFFFLGFIRNRKPFVSYRRGLR